MNLAGEMQMCLVTLDTTLAREIWAKHFSHLEQPKSDAAMLQTLHLARTQSKLLNQRLRFYSHCWLIERGLPSALPDEMRPSAERMYPINVKSVGISVNAKSEIFRPVMLEVRTSMEGAVMEVYADGKQDDIPLIRRRMLEARRTTVRKLLGV